MTSFLGQVVLIAAMITIAWAERIIPVTYCHDTSTCSLTPSKPPEPSCSQTPMPTRPARPSRSPGPCNEPCDIPKESVLVRNGECPSCPVTKIKIDTQECTDTGYSSFMVDITSDGYTNGNSFKLETVIGECQFYDIILVTGQLPYPSNHIDVFQHSVEFDIVPQYNHVRFRAIVQTNGMVTNCQLRFTDEQQQCTEALLTNSLFVAPPYACNDCSPGLECVVDDPDCPIHLPLQMQSLANTFSGTFCASPGNMCFEAQLFVDNDPPLGSDCRFVFYFKFCEEETDPTFYIEMDTFIHQRVTVMYPFAAVLPTTSGVHSFDSHQTDSVMFSFIAQQCVSFDQFDVRVKVGGVSYYVF